MPACHRKRLMRLLQSHKYALLFSILTLSECSLVLKGYLLFVSLSVFSFLQVVFTAYSKVCSNGFTGSTLFFMVVMRWFVWALDDTSKMNNGWAFILQLWLNFFTWWHFIVNGWDYHLPKLHIHTNQQHCLEPRRSCLAQHWMHLFKRHIPSHEIWQNIFFGLMQAVEQKAGFYLYLWLQPRLVHDISSVPLLQVTNLCRQDESIRASGWKINPCKWFAS